MTYKTETATKFITELVEHIRSDNLTRITDMRNFMNYVDKGMCGYVDYTAEDKQREKNNREGKATAPPTIRPQMVVPHLNEVSAQVLTIVSADNNLYSIQPNDKGTAMSKAVNFIYNLYAQLYSHTTAYRQAIYQSLKYNEVLTETVWHAGEAPEALEAVRMGVSFQAQGAEVKVLDLYNLYYDPTVEYDLRNIGERADYVMYDEVETENQIRLKQTRGTYLDSAKVKTILDNKTEPTDFSERDAYKMEGDGEKSTALSRAVKKGTKRLKTNRKSTKAQVTTLHFRATKEELGLDKNHKSGVLYTVRAKILNNKALLALDILGEGVPFPVSGARPLQPELGRNNTSVGESLLRYQDVAAFELARRLKIGRNEANGGTVFMDSTLYDSMKVEDMNDVLGPIPVDMAEMTNPDGTPVNMQAKMFAIPPLRADRDSLANIQTLKQLMNETAPADTSTKMANLQRASIYQAQSVMQQASAINISIAEQLDTQLFKNIRILILTMIIQYANVISYQDKAEEVRIEPSEFNSLDMLRAVSDGLQGTDKFYAVQLFNQLVSTILQSPQERETLDIQKVLDKMVTLTGVSVDFNDIVRTNPLDQLTPEQQQALAAQIQQQQQPQEPTQ